MNTYSEICPAEVFKSSLPLLDVRAPAEFAKGVMPLSCNLPILDDVERSKVGTTYRKAGEVAATALGLELISGAVRELRIDAWRDYLENQPTAVLTCWRGGQRSKIAQNWLAEFGCDVPRVSGGYKAMRRYCLELLDAAVANKVWWVVTGRTGAGKTEIIRNLVNAIDLEESANHRGSAFGAMPTPQPAQATFENHLAHLYLGIGSEYLVVEDESRTIGRLCIPKAWNARMQEAPQVLVETGLEERVAHIENEYVDETLKVNNEADLASRYQAALDRIKRRLGGALHAEISRQLHQAFAGSGSHTAWISTLLEKYYDPMYDYQLERKQARIKFRGNWMDVMEYMREKSE